LELPDPASGKSVARTDRGWRALRRRPRWRADALTTVRGQALGVRRVKSGQPPGVDARPAARAESPMTENRTTSAIARPHTDDLVLRRARGEHFLEGAYGWRRTICPSKA